MKITMYTVTDCQYSKQEKDYLSANKLSFEEKNLETNKELLTEMLAISNNFAGTPVTRVEKDDGSIVVLKGFTKEEFDTVFGFGGAQTVPAANEPAKTEEVVSPPVPPIPPAPTEAASQPVVPTQVETPPAATDVKSDELNSILGKLKQETDQVSPPAPPAPAETSQPPVPTPVETPPANAPSIPDFPGAAKTTA